MGVLGLSRGICDNMGGILPHSGGKVVDYSLPGVVS